jgi:hypothetical protein
MMDSMFYESSGYLGMHDFYVILSFSIVSKYGVMFLYDDYEMLIIVSRVMGIIEYKGFTLVICLVSVTFYDGSL